MAKRRPKSFRENRKRMKHGKSLRKKGGNYVKPRGRRK